MEYDLYKAEFEAARKAEAGDRSVVLRGSIFFTCLPVMNSSYADAERKIPSLVPDGWKFLRVLSIERLGVVTVL